MFDVFGSVKGLLKLDQVCIDNNIFRLHYKATVVILIAFSLLVTSRQYIGDPIDCIVDEIPLNVMDTYCWIYSTFTIPNRLTGVAGKDIVQPGVSSHVDGHDEVKYYTYYQWVCFVLFFQAIACYTPKFIWDTMEGGLMRTIVMGLNIGACKEQEKCSKKKVLLDYLMSHLKRHKVYAFRYMVCEVLCFINIIVQLWLMNRFFNGEFLSYGWDVLQYSDQPQENRVDPMVYVFPRVTKCNFYKYGASGSIQKHDAMCILPLNIVNEKTYIFIWFWFIILACFLAGLIIYRAVILFVPSVRSKLLNARNRMVPRNVAKTISAHLDLGDWWIVYMLARNLDPIIFKDVATELAKRIELNDPEDNENEKKRMQ